MLEEGRLLRLGNIVCEQGLKRSCVAEFEVHKDELVLHKKEEQT